MIRKTIKEAFRLYFAPAVFVWRKLRNLICPEIIICAAVRLSDGRIIRGHRHCHCNRLIREELHTNDFEQFHDQGFITSRNRYVDRVEGLALQKAAGIPSADPNGYRSRELFSEDLY